MTIEISTTGLILLAIWLIAPELLVLPFALLGAIWDILTGKGKQ